VAEVLPTAFICYPAYFH